MNFFLTVILLGGLLLPVFAGQAQAQERFSFEKDNGVIMRFNKETGQITKCIMEKNDVKCTLSKDERLMLERQIIDLKASIAELKQNKDKTSLPSKKDVDSAFDMMKYFVDKFQGFLKEETLDVTPERL